MITLYNLAKHYGGRDIFRDVSVALHEDKRTGLVGVNGSGKTTLLRILVDQESPDAGAVRKPSALTIGYLPQEVEVFGEQTPIDLVLEPFAHLLEYESKIERIADHAQRGDLQERDALAKLADLHEKLEFHDVYSLDARARAILAGLGVPQKTWERPVSELSGGYRMRTVLGRLLLLSPGFLLLDEPTNHLDMDSLVWLEKFLVRYRGGMLIVSHDRDFLNRMCDYTAEIRGGRITIYPGNYDQYIRQREQNAHLEQSRLHRLQEQISQKERFVERFKAKNTKATQAQARVRQIEKLKEQLPKVAASTQTLDFSFPQPQPSGTLPLTCRDLAMSFGENRVFEKISFEVNRGEKVAIVGPNGSGKSTILKLMEGMLKPTGGTVEHGHNATIRYFGQHQLEQLDPGKSCYETVAAVSIRTDKTFVRSILGAFLFSGDDVEKPVRVLSGGEKSRLVLATILANPGNVLLLDEPTNHLDVDSIETLTGALAAFAGTICVVSHDDYFVSRVATRVIEMRPGLIRNFPGTLADYRAYVEQGLWGTSSEERQPSGEARCGDDAKERRIEMRERRKRLQRTVEKLEREVGEHEDELSRLKMRLNDPANALNHELLHGTALSIDRERGAVDDLLDRWERAHAELAELGKE